MYLKRKELLKNFIRVMKVLTSSMTFNKLTFLYLSLSYINNLLWFGYRSFYHRLFLDYKIWIDLIFFPYLGINNGIY